MLQKINRIVIFALFISQIAFPQTKDNVSFNPDPDIPFFYYDVLYYPLAERDSIRTEILVKVPFDAIQFIKDKNEFVAKYEISLLLLNENEVQAASKIWKQEIRTESFEETSSREHFDVNQVRFIIPPGKYFLTIGIMDMDTHKSSFRKKKIDLKDIYSKPIALSKINLIEKIIQNDDDEDELIPAVMDAVSDSEPQFHISFDVLSKGGRGIINYSIYNMEKALVAENTVDKEFENGVTHNLIEIPKKDLKFGKYRLKVLVKIADNKATSEKVFRLRWIGMSNLIENLDEAISQIKYIAPTSVIKSLKKAKEKKRKEIFLDFWKSKDPTPNTKVNELMNEYYRRINYANENFSGFQEGWKTDMGMIFILFGPPNDIERHPFDIESKPYEIWYYYEINRSFIFVDESGFGEYRLVSPIYDLQGIY